MADLSQLIGAISTRVSLRSRKPTVIKPTCATVAGYGHHAHVRISRRADAAVAAGGAGRSSADAGTIAVVSEPAAEPEGDDDGQQTVTDVTGICAVDAPLVVILAAGIGARFRSDRHKLDALLHGRPVLAHVVAAALDSDVGPVLIVSSGRLKQRFDPRATVLVNHRPSDGMASSLRLAVDHALAHGHRRVVVALGDQPFVSPAAWRAVNAGGQSAVICVATYDGRRGHPVSLAEKVWAQLPATGDDGARAVLGRHPEIVDEVPCSGSATDIDTVEDLQRWQNS